MDSTYTSADFRGLPASAQIEVLLRFAHELTIAARDSYEPGSMTLRHPSRLRQINEIQHQVTNHVLALHIGDAQRYPDDVLVSMILDQDDPELRRQVAAALNRALSQPAALPS